jgi:hypothetical protein
MPLGLERIYSPGIFDIALPFVAFFLVIIAPSLFGIYVIINVLSGRYSGKDQRK